MKTWNEIMSEPATPQERLEDLLNLWDDIMQLYGEVPMLFFDTKDFTAHMNQSYVRSVYPSASSSLIKVLPADSGTIQINQILEYMKEDDNNYRLLKGLSNLFNKNLNDLERTVIVRKYFFHESNPRIYQKCFVSRTTFYRIMDNAKNKLINAYGLNLYDDFGGEIPIAE